MKDIIDWDRIKPLLSDLYRNDTEKGGRPNFDPVFMIKVMFLQSLYTLVDVAMETELYSNIRFINIMDYPESMPDARTIWLFRERIVNNYYDNEIWKSIWRQFQEKRITLKKGMIQDGTLIESNPGHGITKKDDGTRSVDLEFPDKTHDQKNPETGMRKKELKAVKRTEKERKKKGISEEKKNARTRRSKDGTWAVKRGKAHFGHKFHTSQTIEHDIIANYALTTESIQFSDRSFHTRNRKLQGQGIFRCRRKGDRCNHG